MADEYQVAVTQILPDGTLKVYFANKSKGLPATFGDETPGESMARVAAAGPDSVDVTLLASATLAMQRHYAEISQAVEALRAENAKLASDNASLRAEKASA